MALYAIGDLHLSLGAEKPIIYSIYQYMEESGKKEGILFIDEINWWKPTKWSLTP